MKKSIHSKYYENIFYYKEAITHLIGGSYFLSLIFTLLILYFYRPFSNEFIVEQVSKKRTSIKSPYLIYYDLDKDGYSEKIKIYTDSVNTGVMVYKKNGVIDQWNFKGEIRPKNPLYGWMFFGDINNDGTDEIFPITLFRDTIYLSCFNPFENKYYFKEIPISSYHKYNGGINAEVFKCALYDINNDSISEVYFSISSGFSKFPRRMYAYDYINDTLYSSPYGFISYPYPLAFDLDKDGKPEFFGSPSAVGNCNKLDNYSDHYLWLAVLDEKMNFEFEPKIIGYYPSVSSMTAFSTDNGNFIASLIYYKGTKNIKSSISLFDPSGMKIEEKQFEKSFNLNNARLFSNWNYNRLFFIQKTGEIDELNEKLEVISKYNIPPIADGFPYKYDLDNDGENELLFWGKNFDNIIITEKDFTNAIIFKFPEFQNPNYFALKKNGNEGNELFIFGEKYIYVLRYKRNLLYYFRFLIYAGLYGGILIVVLFLHKTQKRRLKQKYLAERKMAELQLRSIKNQLDPHFALNIINSIGSLFTKQDTQKANYIFGKYSKMLRNTIVNSDKIITTLYDEIDYVRSYLELEKFRLSYKFDYVITIDKTVNKNIEIPKTLIHTFVENAIKHGISHSDKTGLLTITVSEYQKNYIVVIKDNGIGRKLAQEKSLFSTGKGLSILNQILCLYELLEKVKITYEILDLFDKKGEPEGTEVRIRIPIKNVKTFAKTTRKKYEKN